jgi:hypothetical protein
MWVMPPGLDFISPGIFHSWAIQFPSPLTSPLLGGEEETGNSSFRK